MLPKFLRHRAAVGAVLVASMLLTASIVGPAFGAPSPLSVATKALKIAKKAKKTARSANKRSKRALAKASSAQDAAGVASTKADGAQTTADGAASSAQRAINLAKDAAAHSGPGAFGVDLAEVPNDGSSAEADALCPDGYTPIAGGVYVYNTIDGTVVTTGIAVTESAIDDSLHGWSGAVQDTDNSSGREMVVTVQCAKPTFDEDFAAARRR